MTTPDDSLRQFFGGEGVESFRAGLATFLKSDEYAGIRKEVSSRLRTIKWPGAVEKIAAHADLLLDTPLSDALARLYAKSHVLDQYLDPENYDANEVVLVELARHTVKSTHAPHLDIVISGQPVGELKLDIALKLELEGLILKIRDSRIMEISPGTCNGSGTVSFYGKVLASKKSGPVALPGTITLGEGIALALRIEPAGDPAEPGSGSPSTA